MNFKLSMGVFVIFLLFFGCINLDTGDSTTDEITEVDENSVETIITIGEEETTTTTGVIDTEEPEVEETPLFIEDPHSMLSIYFIDVSYGTIQGEAILIKKGQYEILLDSGPVETSQRVVNFLDGKVEGNLELLILSHDDVGHWGGTESILETFTVEKVLWNGDSYSTEFDSLVASIKQKEIPMQEAQTNTILETNGASLLVMNPPEEKFKKADTDSISMKLSFKNFCMLFLSDTVYGSQANMIDLYKDDLDCDALQVPFHGMGTGNTHLNFLLLHMSPDIAVITGSEEIENPSNSVLRDPAYQQIEWSGADLYKTFENGNVKISTDGIDHSAMYVQ